MAIMSKGPGKRTKAAPKKATVKSTVSMVKNMFSTGGKNVGKAKGPGGLAGVKNLENVTVTGSKKAGIQGLKAKKKSGEMSRAEANAKIKNLRGISVTGKKQPVKKTYGAKKDIFVGAGEGKKSTYYTSSKEIPSDSAKFMQQMQSTNPAAYRSAMNFMTKQQKANPGARFEFTSGQAASGDVSSGRPGGKPKLITVPGIKNKQASFYVPRIKTVLPNKKKK